MAAMTAVSAATDVTGAVGATTKPTDVRPVGTALYLLPVKTRVPLKFGVGVVTHVTCARVRLRVRNAAGQEADGWGETPLSVQWVWPSALAYEVRERALNDFSVKLAGAWAEHAVSGHPMEVGHAFLEQQLPALLAAFNHER